MAGRGLPGPRRLLALALLVLLAASPSEPAPTEAEALLEFKGTLSDSGGEIALQSWTEGSTPCSGSHNIWKWVVCVNGKVWALQLESMGLSGSLNITPLATLPTLRSLSVMDNNFVGPIPDFSLLGALKNIYLSNNQFSGPLPDSAFSSTRSLKKLFLSNNEFSGPLPSSLSRLTKLLYLRLDDNEFDGPLPDLHRSVNLKLLNVSFNKLSGPIPSSVRMMDASLFAGNDGLCGSPLEACPSAKKPAGPLIGIIVGCVLALLFIVLIVILVWRRQRGQDDDDDDDEGDAPAASARRSEAVDADRLEQGAAVYAGGAGSGHVGRRGSGKEGEHGRLTYVKDEKERFELADLLKASAEVLGSGNFGSSYKAVLVNGPSVVVKRFKDMNRVGREDFQEHMRRLGRFSHPNVLPLVAYYYRKEEKLLITNYILNGSLAHMLHGSRGSSLPPLEWPTRLRIIRGVARGLSYLYEELPMLTLPHGHLKSSNVLIDDSFEALLTDYALVPVVSQTHASQVMVAYKSPEVTGSGKPTKKSDVWSLGILILEVMTGKFPSTYLQKGKGGADLTEWVEAVVKEEEFDDDMRGAATKSERAQMAQMWQIGLGCCEANPDLRWDIKDVLDRIEDIKEEEDDEDDEDEEGDSSMLSEVDLSKH